MAQFSVNTEPSDMSRAHQAREAGQIIYGSLSTSGDHSYNRGSSQYVIMPWDTQACCGIMSPVRRTFCLLVTFDIILTFILWVIYTQLLPDTKGEYDKFISEIVHYNFKTSMFDNVMCAAWRLVPLLLAYALFRIQNPYIVAITTAGTCAFVLVKVFMFKFDHGRNNVICYMLLIVSVLISWIEVWFLDFKVLPQENKMRNKEASGIIDENSRLLGRDGTIHSPGEHFYSPAASRDPTPGESDDEEVGFTSLPPSRGHSRTQSFGSVHSSIEELDYIQKAQDAWEKTWELDQEEGWKKETGNSMETGIVYSKQYPKIGKMFKAEAMIEASPDLLFEELVLKGDQQAEWNPTVLEIRSLVPLDDTTDVFYTVAADAAGGLVTSRDFVSVRHWGLKDKTMVSAGCAVFHPDMPPTKKYVRGENGPGGWIFKPVPGSPNRCHLSWILNTDLKGWIPQYAVDQALSGTLLDFIKNVQTRVSVIRRIRDVNES